MWPCSAAARAPAAPGGALAALGGVFEHFLLTAAHFSPALEGEELGALCLLFHARRAPPRARA
jgi:hypothetical protein